MGRCVNFFCSELAQQQSFRSVSALKGSVDLLYSDRSLCELMVDFESTQVTGSFYLLTLFPVAPTMVISPSEMGAIRSLLIVEP